jgi:hypothetical protein
LLLFAWVLITFFPACMRAALGYVAEQYSI